MIRQEFAPGLFACLAHHGFDERFPVFQVARRLVQDDTASSPLLHEQEAAFLFGNGRDSQVDLLGHGRIIGRQRGRATFRGDSRLHFDDCDKGDVPFEGVRPLQRCCWRVSASGSLAIQISSK